MNKLLNWFLDKKANTTYLGISCLVVIIAYLVNINFREKSLTIALSESIFWLTVPVLIFSVINLFFKGSIFVSWAKFTKYFFIVSLAIILMTPTSTHGMDFLPIVKETVAVALAILYSVASLFLITYLSFRKEKINH